MYGLNRLRKGRLLRKSSGNQPFAAQAAPFQSHTLHQPRIYPNLIILFRQSAARQEGPGLKAPSVLRLFQGPEQAAEKGLNPGDVPEMASGRG